MQTLFPQQKTTGLFFICLLVSPSTLPSVVDVEELQQQLTQSSTQREEIIRLKQELRLLHRELLLSGTRAATQQTRHQRFLTDCFLLCHQERETAGKMSCWNWLAPNRNAPCRSCAAYNRYAVSPAIPPHGRRNMERFNVTAGRAPRRVSSFLLLAVSVNPETSFWSGSITEWNFFSFSGSLSCP